MRYPAILAVLASFAVVTPLLAQSRVTSAAGAKAAGATAASATDAIVARATKAYESIRTARATFTQTLTNPLTGSVSNAAGEYVQQRPSRLSVRFTEPKGDRIVSDGRTLWVYLPSTNPSQVMKLPATDAATGTLDLASQFFTAPRTRYTITSAGQATIGGKRTDVLTLVPKTSALFTRATVWVDATTGHLRQFEVSDATGLLRKVTLTSLRVNTTVRASEFTFTPPKGVTIVDQAAMMGGSR